ncbi:protein-glutamate O-methyltransferase CheR [Novosphingobium sp. FKTRR1]|uniref:CheR family methyltransferase n=1 Tax=Novosphingobium sp. FKTRR1 TaxID=2879118 RepID=UPI001CF03F7D|nr:CheR family methyltransferase [Novosphingobium sp. FKTRR1]
MSRHPGASPARAPAAIQIPAIQAGLKQSANPASTLNPRQFRKIANIIEAQTGIKMPDSKLHLIEGRLWRRMRDGGFASLNDYCEHIASGLADADTMTDFINAVTTNKTDFFREPAHFDYLSEEILPAFHAGGHSRMRCWSAAASTGMEAYTLAMVLDDFRERRGDFDYRILATDIDTDVLEQARKGVYPAASLDPVPQGLRRRYVRMANNPARKEGRIVPELRSRISFARLNLMDDAYPVGDPMDVIFARNVLIYFDKLTQAKVITRLCDRLHVGGHLILGHSESIAGLDLPLKTVAHTVFRKL